MVGTAHARLCPPYAAPSFDSVDRAVRCGPMVNDHGSNDVLARQICLRNSMRAVEHVASAGHDDWIAQVRVKDITRMLSNPADGRLHIVRPAKPNHLVKNIQLFDRNGDYRLSVGH